MAAYKMNKFHFHLSDDEGWRIEIPGLPELTDIGSKRCHDLTETKCLLPQLGSGPNANNNGSGYFSKADYIEIVRYAQARNIEVIPEIDTPAHMRAAVVSMEARYQKLSKAGKMAEANEYRLLDPTDTSNLTSVQFYDKKNCLNIFIN
jgi:hexosaminidase